MRQNEIFVQSVFRKCPPSAGWKLTVLVSVFIAQASASWYTEQSVHHPLNCFIDVYIQNRMR